MSDATGSVATFGYDKVGNRTSISNTLAGLTPTVTLAQYFDAYNRRTQLSATIGSTADFKTNYTYDALDRLTRITQEDVSGGNTVADKRVDFTYLADGQFDTILRYADLGGTDLVAESAYGYDDAGRLTSLDHFKGGTTFAGYAWGYNNANQINRFTNSEYSGEDVWHYYDPSGQLRRSDRTSGSDENYVYDDNGNRITGNGDTYTTGTNNQMESDDVFDYTYLCKRQPRWIGIFRGVAGDFPYALAV